VTTRRDALPPMGTVDGQLTLFGSADSAAASEATPAQALAGIAVAVSRVWSGVLLAPTRVSGRLVRPVVRVLPAGIERIRAGSGPELDRSTLALWESWRADMGEQPPARPVRVVGFLVEDRWRAAVSTAVRLAGFGASLMVRRSAPRHLRSAEADYHGITVVLVDRDGTAEVAVRGRSGPVPGAVRTTAVRHLEERLFDRLLDQGGTTVGGPLRS
jgi:hypothetical protein